VVAIAIGTETARMMGLGVATMIATATEIGTGTAGDIARALETDGTGIAVVLVPQFTTEEATTVATTELGTLRERGVLVTGTIQMNQGETVEIVPNETSRRGLAEVMLLAPSAVASPHWHWLTML